MAAVTRGARVFTRVRACPHLVDVEVVDDGVEAGVEVVEQRHHLHGGALGRQRREPHDVAEVDGDAVEGLRLHRLPSLQLLRHRAEGGV